MQEQQQQDLNNLKGFNDYELKEKFLLSNGQEATAIFCMGPNAYLATWFNLDSNQTDKVQTGDSSKWIGRAIPLRNEDLSLVQAPDNWQQLVIVPNFQDAGSLVTSQATGQPSNHPTGQTQDRPRIM